MERLRRRADFVAVAAGGKIASAAFVLQVLGRGDPGPARLGFTVSRKVGTAVERNRVRRRLKEAVRHLPPGRLQAGHDYVLIGRRASLTLSFDRMVEELRMALWRLEPRRLRPDISAEPAGIAIGQGGGETTDH